MIQEHFIALPPVGEESKPLRVRGHVLAWRWSWWGAATPISVGGTPPRSGLLLHLRRRGVEVARQFVGYEGRVSVADVGGFDEATIENLTNTPPSLYLYFRFTVGGPGDVPAYPPELVNGYLGPQGVRAAGYIHTGEADDNMVAPLKAGGVDDDGTIWPLPLATQTQAYQGAKALPVRLRDAEQIFDATATGGAALSSGALDVRKWGALYVLAQNLSGATARYLNCHVVRDDASEWTDYMGISVGVGAAAPVSYSRGAFGSAVWTQPTKTRRWSIAAAGADSVRLTIWGAP